MSNYVCMYWLYNKIAVLFYLYAPIKVHSVFVSILLQKLIVVSETLMDFVKNQYNIEAALQNTLMFSFMSITNVWALKK